MSILVVLRFYLVKCIIANTEKDSQWRCGIVKPWWRINPCGENEMHVVLNVESSLLFSLFEIVSLLFFNLYTDIDGPQKVMANDGTAIFSCTYNK